MKKKVREIEPLPSKRIFQSIIADYDLNRSICELIDNAIDEWTNSGRRRSLRVKINFDLSQQSIQIEDNAGGVHKDNLEMLVGPGLSGRVPANLEYISTAIADLLLAA